MKILGKRYGDTRTNLKLTDKAQIGYDMSDPISIYEMPDGSYIMTGVIEADNLTEEDVNNKLEDMKDIVDLLNKIDRYLDTIN